MLSVHLVLEICCLKVVVSFNFAPRAPHVKRRVKSCEPRAAAAIYGEVHPDYLVSALSRVFSHPTCDQNWRDLSDLLARVDERRQQRYRKQRNSDGRRGVSGRAELIGLVDSLKQIKT